MTNTEKAFREKLVKLALSYVGTQEPRGDDQFINWYNQQTGSTFNVNSTPWCCIFASYCLNKAGVNPSRVKPFSGCKFAIDNYFKPAGVYKLKTTGYIPEPGDLIFFDWNIDKCVDHVGIVQKVANDKVYTVEGNSKGGYSVSGVRNKSYKLCSDYILGYASPNYTGSNGAAVATASTSLNFSSAAKTTTSTKNPYIVKFQEFLNKNYGKKLEVDGSYGPLTKKAAIEAWQHQMNVTYKSKLEVDGSFGPLCKKAARSMTKGAKTPLVYIMQGLLYANGYDPNGFDGEFGSGCQAAIKKLQKDHGLNLTGTCNTDTWTVLFSK